MFSNIFYCPQDNNCVLRSVKKLFDALAFQKIKSTREGNDEKSDNFGMGILY